MTSAPTTGRPTELDVSGRTIRASLHLPDGAERADAALPAVMLCETHTLLGLDESDLLGEIAASLLARGRAVIRYEPSMADLTLAGVDTSWAQHRVDEAAAVFEWTLCREPLDRRCVGVLGYGLGALIVATMAGRTDRIERLCLLAVPSMDSAARLVTGDDEPTDATSTPGTPGTVLTESLDELAPVEGVLAFERPTLIVHGAADTQTGPEDRLAFLNAVAGASECVQQLIIPRGNHTFTDPGARQACVSQIGRFFAEAKPNRRNGRK